jgi:hypothetical protein
MLLDALFGGVHGDIAAVRLRYCGCDRGVRIAARVGVGGWCSNGSGTRWLSYGP